MWFINPCIQTCSCPSRHAAHQDVLPVKTCHTTTRAVTANYILSHMDDFLPFLPSEVGEDAVGATDAGLMTPVQFQRYCDAICTTVVWGGEPEILAFSLLSFMSI